MPMTVDDVERIRRIAAIAIEDDDWLKVSMLGEMLTNMADAVCYTHHKTKDLAEKAKRYSVEYFEILVDMCEHPEERDEQWSITKAEARKHRRKERRERCERLAEKFHADTGMIAPENNVAAPPEGPALRERYAAWDEWLEGQTDHRLDQRK